MEKRLLLAIFLMIGAVVAANLLFPPPPPPVPPPAEERESPARAPPDSVGLAEDAGERGAVVPEEADDERNGAERRGATGHAAAIAEPTPAVPVDEDTVLVRTPLAEYRFSTRGAALLGVRLLRYDSYAEEDDPGARVELVRPGERLFGYRVAAAGDTLDLGERTFEVGRSELELLGSPGELVFRHEVEGTPLGFVVAYRFSPDSYRVEVRGAFEGLGGRGYTLLTGLDEGLRTNEANPKEDHDHLAYVAHGRAGGYPSEKLSGVEPDERIIVEGGPFRWVGLKSKYFLAALVSDPSGPGFGGMVVTGVPREHAARVEISLPVPAGSPEFGFEAFLGPQDYGRLAAVGQNLQNVNPYGYRWLRPIIRPLVGLIMVVLVWMHETFSLAYGWVLVAFGVAMRVVLFPLYQKSMRAQMAQMQVQPLVKELQSKYKDDPQKMQKEMVKLYKEHNINPLAGCLPMMLPFPILITLFFVFQNTIEFRGVPFLWLPDLSLKDPFYIIPVLMGLSMFLLQWIGQRGMEPNPQMKIMGYALPVVFTVLFLNFPSGLNLYYATSNFASLPQQFYLARERRKARASAPSG